jgi:hypothetical protein
MGNSCMLRVRFSRPAGFEWVDGTNALIVLQDLIRLSLASHGGVLDLAHAPDILGEAALEPGIHRCVVDRHDISNQVWLAEGKRHGRFGTPGTAHTNSVSSLYPPMLVSESSGLHRVAYECRLLQAVLLDEARHVVGHGQIVVSRRMR